MARIDWAVVADVAFFDCHARLCMVGIATRLLVPALPVIVRQMMVVARVVDPHPGVEMDVGAAVLTPTGQWAVPDDPDERADDGVDFWNQVICRTFEAFVRANQLYPALEKHLGANPHRVS